MMAQEETVVREEALQAVTMAVQVVLTETTARWAIGITRLRVRAREPLQEPLKSLKELYMRQVAEVVMDSRKVNPVNLTLEMVQEQIIPLLHYTPEALEY